MAVASSTHCCGTLTLLTLRRCHQPKGETTARRRATRQCTVSCCAALRGASTATSVPPPPLLFPSDAAGAAAPRRDCSGHRARVCWRVCQSPSSGVSCCRPAFFCPRCRGAGNEAEERGNTRDLSQFLLTEVRTEEKRHKLFFFGCLRPTMHCSSCGFVRCGQPTRTERMESPPVQRHPSTEQACSRCAPPSFPALLRRSWTLFLFLFPPPLPFASAPSPALFSHIPPQHHTESPSGEATRIKHRSVSPLACPLSIPLAFFFFLSLLLPQ